jgi:hypothetical protein
MDAHLTKIEAEIADVETRLAGLRAAVAHCTKANSRLALVCEIKEMEAVHEQLLRQVQWATVGAAKPGQVL